MTTIKASCHKCGDVTLTPAEMTLKVCNIEARSFYSFICPECKDQVQKPASEEIIALLISGGVPAVQWHIPLEAEEEHSGDPVGYDEVLDFALWLEGLGDESPLKSEFLGTQPPT